MTDREKIFAAWAECPPFPEGQRHRVQVPQEDMPMVPWENGTEAIGKEVVYLAVEFRHQRGVLEGRPVRRVMGRLGDTDVQVAHEFI